MSSRKSARKAGKSITEDEESKARLSTMKVQLTRSEKRLTKVTDRAERWKKEAKTHRKAASQAAALAERLQQELDRATSSATVQTDDPRPRGASPVDLATTAQGRAVPNESWSVIQLRAEARTRGLVGLSNKPKADLIAALS